MLNNITIYGRLTADTELKETNDGLKVVRFSIANERPFTKNGNKTTDFFNIVAWNKTAEFINKYFHKGDAIILTGRVQIDNWKDKDGNSRQSFYILANTADFCSGKKSEEQAAEPKPTKDENGFINFSDYVENELPFK